MKKVIMSTLLSLTLAIAGGDIVSNVGEVPKVETNTKWEQSLSIYGWLTSFDGTLKYSVPGTNPGDPDESGESSIADKIDTVLMGWYEVRQNKWLFLVDGIYLKMSDSQNIKIPLLGTTLGSEQKLTAWLVSAYGGYNVLDNTRTRLDIIAGVRYFALDVDISFLRFNSRVFSTELYDAIVGVKGYVNLTENWYVPYKFDIGTGDSDLTWQGEASIGYRFDWGDVLASYRYIHYAKDDSRLINEFDIYGPKIGVVFHF